MPSKHPEAARVIQDILKMSHIFQWLSNGFKGRVKVFSGLQRPLQVLRL